MRKTEIKQGKWYETKSGVGECLSAGGNFPWSAQIRITHPFPRGTLNVEPRDVLREVPAPVVVTPPPGETGAGESKAGPVEMPGAPPKASVLHKTATPERKHGPHGPNCHCQEGAVRVSVEFEAIVPDEESGKKIAEMFSAIALLIKSTGLQTRFQAGVYGRVDDEPHHEPKPQALDPNLN